MTGPVSTSFEFAFTPAGNAATTGSVDEGTITYQVVGVVGGIQQYGARVTVTYTDDADPGPSGTILTASPSGPSVGQPTTLTAATTSPLGGTYDWAFGDGGTASSSGTPAVTHVYRSAGDYIASVRVTDPLGKTDSAIQTIHVSVPLAPAFSLSASTVGVGQAIDVDGSRSSTDPEATISGWSWDFGDGTHATGKTASYAYAATGTYTVTETVTDSLGRTAPAPRDVVVQAATTGGGTPPPAAGPHAAWALATTSPVAGAVTAFDGTGSTDDGGTIVSCAWAFGDGLTGAGASPRHVFADGGSYPVTLTVTDDSGHSSSATHLVSVGYAPPTAAFTTGPASPVAGQSVSFDAGGSSVPAPGPANYAWSFGDGAQASGPTATHAFPAQGSYAVTLTVTDAGGRSA